MLVVTRFRAPESEHHAFAAGLQNALSVLEEQEGYLDGWAGRNVDDPMLWTIVTRWRDVGSYRRALSSYDVKAGAVPVLSRAIDEPSAYQLLGEELNEARPRELG